MSAAAPARRVPTVSVAAIAWVLVVVLFILLRVGVVWRAPVGGAELAHLAGAWQARIGMEDDRYVPTLYQAVTALTLNWTESEEPARALALAGTATIPLALFLLRRKLGEGGALLALLLLALDPASILLGVTATAAAWDAAIAIWLVVALVASRPPPWGWLLIAFLVTTGGPLTLPVVLAGVVLGAIRGSRPGPGALAWGAAGAALGLLLTSLQFGVGTDGLRIAPFALFAAGFDEPWSTLNVAQLAAHYELPLLVGGAAAGVWLVVHFRATNRAPTPAETLSLAMAGLAIAWFLVALPTTSPFPLAAATLSSCLLLGPALARAASFLMTAQWGRHVYLLLFALGLAAVALFVLSDWAREGRIGGLDERVMVAVPVFLALLAVSLLALALLSTQREEFPIAFLPVLAAGGLLLLAGTSGVSLSAAGEPLPGPITPASARAIRDVAFDATASRGPLVVHQRYREELTWPFRGSPTFPLAGHVPPEAAVAIWPAAAPPPEGFVALEGRWVLKRSIRAPDGFLDLVYWFAERNSLDEDLELVVIYVRSP
ncbi:MAG: hypothetical protein OXE43_13310 [Chloroflexi bacterium]|nr:hypothetical protein [Chloroflexota bacterium]